MDIRENSEDFEFDSLDEGLIDSSDEEYDSLDDVELIDDTDEFRDGVDASVDDLMDDDDNDDEYTEAENDNFGGALSPTGEFVVMDTDNPEQAFEFKMINIENIGATPRIRQNPNVEDLVRSIKSTGLLMPIVVANTATVGQYVLIDGYRRLSACIHAGKKVVPAIINNNVNTPDIMLLESLYNHARKYTIKETIDYIDKLEKDKGIMNPAMIEYLLQMNNGDYSKLKDIISDNDEDIVDKLFNGVWDIDTAFRKLEQRRKKETLEEKENKKAAKVYDDEEESGVDQIQGTGDDHEDGMLTENQIDALMINPENLDDGLDDTNIDEMIEEDNNIDGFKPHKQKVGEREYIDPVIKKTVMTRDNSTCQCCKRGGEQYVDVLDYHHILPVFLGGNDTPENGVMLCVACHRMVHLYSTDDLHVDSALLNDNYDDLDEAKKVRYPNEQIFEDEKMRLKRIIRLGSVIRKGIAAKGLNKKKYKEEHSNNGIGRRKPGVNSEQEKA